MRRWAFRSLPCFTPRLSRRTGHLPFCTTNKPLFMASHLPTPEVTVPLEVAKAFRYSPIPDDGTIRILTLRPGQGDEPLAGELTTENLAAAQPYEAISYMWGTGARRTSLVCNNGRYLPLTQSIHDTLSCMRDPSRPRRLWADQICINQDDVAERSQQVTLMNAIYKSAAKVLVWLGRDEEGVADEAVGMVKYLNDVFEDEEAHQIFKRAHSEGLGSQSEEPWVPLSKLTKQPWVGKTLSITISAHADSMNPSSLGYGLCKKSALLLLRRSFGANPR